MFSLRNRKKSSLSYPCYFFLTGAVVDYNITTLATTGKEEISFNPIALRKAKIVYNIDLFECNRANYFCL